MRILRFARSGVIAGLLSALAFAVVHLVLISDIFFSLIPMLIAGGVCGASLGATYAFVAVTVSVREWLGFNATFVLLFVLLGIASEIVFEPILTAAEVLAAGEPPGILFTRSLPFMGVFTVLATAVLSLRYGRDPQRVAALFATTVVLMVALGMNVGIFGLVQIPTAALPLVGMLFLLILVLAGAYAVTFLCIEWRTLTQND